MILPILGSTNCDIYNKIKITSETSESIILNSIHMQINACSSNIQKNLKNLFLNSLCDTVEIHHYYTFRAVTNPPRNVLIYSSPNQQIILVKCNANYSLKNISFISFIFKNSMHVYVFFPLQAIKGSLSQYSHTLSHCQISSKHYPYVSLTG